MTSPMRFFLVISVCLHLAVVAKWTHSHRISMGDTGNPIQLVLAPKIISSQETISSRKPLNTTPGKVPSKAIVTSKQILSTTASKIHQKEKIVAPVGRNTDRTRKSLTQTNNKLSATVTFREIDAEPPGLASTTANLAQGSSDHSAQISAALRRQLAAYFRYPQLAKKHGWEGQVMLSLRLQPDGRMTHVQVVQSSGHLILDRSAVRSAKNAGGVPEVIDWLAGQSFDMAVPIHYQLIGS